jgi:TM2 domain-containing membrane protein YozV
MSNIKPPRSRAMMVVICFFFGILGIHRLLMGYKNWWLMLLTFGAFGIWMLLDLKQITSGSMKMADGQDLT